MTMSNSVRVKSILFAWARRAVAAVALICSFVCLILLLAGFVPFWGREMNAVSAFNGVFEIFNLGRRSALYCLFSTAFSTVYIIAVVKMIISIISGLVGMGKWLFKGIDNKDTREATRRNVRNANSSIWWLFFVYIMSYLMYGFSLGGFSLLTFIGFILFSVALNFAQDILFKRRVLPCVVSALNRGIMLASVIIFAFFSTNIHFSQIFEGLGFVFSDSANGGTSFFLQIFIQQILSPIFNLIVVFTLISLNAKINNDDFEGKDSVRGFLISNSVFLGIMVIGLGFVNRYTNFTDYIDLLGRHMVFAVVTAMVYVTGVNDVVLPKDAKYMPVGSHKSESNAEDAE